MINANQGFQLMKDSSLLKIHIIGYDAKSLTTKAIFSCLWLNFLIKAIKKCKEKKFFNWHLEFQAH